MLKLVCCALVATLVLGQDVTMDKNKYYSKEMLTPEYGQSHLTKVYTSKTGRKVYVFDDVISYSLLSLNRMYFSANDNWRYVLFDKYVVDSDGKFDGGNGIPWKSWQNPTLYSSTRMGSILKTLVDSAVSKADNETKKRDFKMTEIYSAIARRGDTPQLYSNSNASATTIEGYSTVTFTNTLWLKNSYGEILFYENDDNLDIFGAIFPKFGRTVVWDSAIPYIVRPPSITTLAGQYMIFSQFHWQQDVVYKKRTHFFDLLENLKDSYFNDFVCSDNVDKVGKVDLDHHLTLRRHNKAGDFVAVFDKLFSKADLDALRTHSVKYGKYFYDDSLDMSSDNVQWIAGFNVDNFVKSRFWPVISQMADYVTGFDSWYPYDVACNLIRSSDHTRFHLDTSHDNEKEVTFLLYLSPNWTAADYGETAFMELNHDSPENDYVAEVVPMYGRAVIFNGTFPHSAHPPAPSYGGPRYTFAVKLSFTKRMALLKTHSEESRHSYFNLQESVRSVVQNPELFEAQQKITTVLSHLQTKAVQAELDYVKMRDPGPSIPQMYRDELTGKPPQDPQDQDDKEQGEEEAEGVEEDDESKFDLQRFQEESEDMDLNATKEEREAMEQLIDEDLLGETQMNKETFSNILEMIRHYRIPELMSKDKSSSEPLNFSKIVSNVTEKQRERVMPAWTRICEKDDSCLQDYLELFLRQHFRLRRENIQALFTAI